MGLTHVTVKCSANNDMKKVYEADFLVDTGATDSLAPGNKLKEAGIEPVGKTVYELANGDLVEYEFGLSVIEAQACGVPVIASDVQSLNEIIIDEVNGLLFDFENNKQLADKIRLIYNNKSLKNKLIHNGLETVRKYSIQRYLKKLEMIYNSIK